MKKIFVILTAFTLLCGALSGCGNSTPSAEQTSPVPSTSSDITPVSEVPATADEEQISTEEPSTNEEEPIAHVDYPLTTDGESLSFFLAAPSGPPVVEESWADLQVFQDCEALTGVHIDWHESSFMVISENFALMTASDDYCDMINGFNIYYPGGLSAAYNHGVIIDLSEYTDTYMPNYSGYTHTDELYSSVLSDNGSELAICEIGDKLDIQAGIFVRQDWLDELNLELPTSVEALTGVLAQFKDTYGCTEAISMAQSTAYLDGGALTSPYGITGYTVSNPGTDHFYLDENGNVAETLCADGYREYLMQLNEWYDAGYFTFEALLENNSSNDEMDIASGVTGVFGASATAVETYYSYTEDPNYALSPVGALSKTDGEEAMNHFYKAYLVSTSTAVSVSSQCSNVELACQWMDYWYSPDGILAMNYGPKDVSWYYNENGEIKYTELLTNDPNWAAPTLIMKYNFKNRIFGVAYQDSNSDYYSEIQAIAVEEFRNHCDNTQRLPANYLYLTDEESDTYTSLFGDISSYADSTVLQFITGELSFDQWSSFQENLKKMGIDDCIAVYQAAYQRYLERA